MTGDRNDMGDRGTGRMVPKAKDGIPEIYIQTIMRYGDDH
jgi:hypothetical protein